MNQWVNNNFAREQQLLDQAKKIFSTYAPFDHQPIIVKDAVEDRRWWYDEVNEAYRLDTGDGLRFDHTCTLMRSGRTRGRWTAGLCFRNGPKGTGRSNQFLQADLDYPGSIENALEAIRLFFENSGLPVTICVNDLSVLYKHMPRDRGLMHLIDARKKMSPEDFSLKLSSFMQPAQYEARMRRVTEELADSFGHGVTVCPELVRGFSYYEGKVLEVFCKRWPQLSLAAGGQYLMKGALWTGVTLGISRLATLFPVPIRTVLSFETRAQAAGWPYSINASTVMSVGSAKNKFPEAKVICIRSSTYKIDGQDLSLEDVLRKTTCRCRIVAIPGDC